MTEVTHRTQRDSGPKFGGSTSLPDRYSKPRLGLTQLQTDQLYVFVGLCILSPTNSVDGVERFDLTDAAKEKLALAFIEKLKLPKHLALDVAMDIVNQTLAHLNQPLVFAGYRKFIERFDQVIVEMIAVASRQDWVEFHHSGKAFSYAVYIEWSPNGDRFRSEKHELEAREMLMEEHALAWARIGTRDDEFGRQLEPLVKAVAERLLEFRRLNL